MDPSIRHGYRQTGRQADRPTFGFRYSTNFDQDFVCGIQNSYTYNHKSKVVVALKGDVYWSDASINSNHQGGAMFDDGGTRNDPGVRPHWSLTAPVVVVRSEDQRKLCCEHFFIMRL